MSPFVACFMFLSGASDLPSKAACEAGTYEPKKSGGAWAAGQAASPENMAAALVEHVILDLLIWDEPVAGGATQNFTPGRFAKVCKPNNDPRAANRSPHVSTAWGPPQAPSPSPRLHTQLRHPKFDVHQKRRP